MATFCPDGLCIAELGRGERKGQQFESFYPRVRGSEFASQDLPDNTISSLADDILNVVLLAHIEGDLARAGWVGGLSSRHFDGSLGLLRNGRAQV